MKLVKTLSLAVILMVCTSLYSQNISNYLNDGISSSGKNILKIAYDPLNWELPLMFEHSVFKQFSYEIGAGPVWIAKQKVFHLDEPLPIKQTGIGFTAWIKPKFYFKAYPERIYFSIYPRFTVMDKKLFFDIVFANVGYQRIVLTKIVIGVEAGAALRIYKDPIMAGSVGFSNTSANFLLPLMITLGYIL